MAIQHAQPNVGDMLQEMIRRGVTAENVGALEKLVTLYERMEERNAEKEFAQAFNALQADMPKISAKKAVPNGDGSVRYRFAPYEEIMEQVAPCLQKHGFTITFSQRYSEGQPQRLIAICTLQHVSGHSKTNEFAVRVGQGPPKASEAQADGAAGTYAKRFALCNALNIVVETDSDARLEGAPITKEQAASLRDRVKATASMEASFLKFGGVTLTPGAPITLSDYERIPSAKYALLDEQLRKKEKVS